MRYFELLTESTSSENGHAVALAIHAMTDLPLVALMVGKQGPKTVANVMVKSSEDAFLDSQGHRSLIEILDDAEVEGHDPSGWEVREITPKVLLNWSNGKRLPVITKAMAAQAKQRAIEIIGSLGLTAR